MYSFFLLLYQVYNIINIPLAPPLLLNSKENDNSTNDAVGLSVSKSSVDVVETAATSSTSAGNGNDKNSNKVTSNNNNVIKEGMNKSKSVAPLSTFSVSNSFNKLCVDFWLYL